MLSVMKMLFESQKKDAPTISIIRSKKEIVSACRIAQEQGTAVGILCPPIADGLLLVGIEHISSFQREEVITLRPYDMNGIYLRRTQISLSEIRSLIPFDCKYTCPVMKSPVPA